MDSEDSDSAKRGLNLDDEIHTQQSGPLQVICNKDAFGTEILLARNGMRCEGVCEKLSRMST